MRDVSVAGNTFPEAARVAAREPTIFAVGRGLAPFGIGFSRKSFLGGAVDRADVPWIGLKENLGEDRALPQTVTSLLARRVVSRVVGTASPPVLVDGYVRAMEVIAREWRVGEGPQGAVAPSTRARARAAGVVRMGAENQLLAVGLDGAPRPAAELLADPGLAATVLSRLAPSKAVGRRVAPADVYAPFVSERVPPGVSSRRRAGTVPESSRAKAASSAWGRAVLAGSCRPTSCELADADQRTRPCLRLSAPRPCASSSSTTYGATVKPGAFEGHGRQRGACAARAGQPSRAEVCRRGVCRAAQRFQLALRSAVTRTRSFVARTRRLAAGLACSPAQFRPSVDPSGMGPASIDSGGA